MLSETGTNDIAATSLFDRVIPWEIFLILDVRTAKKAIRQR